MTDMTILIQTGGGKVNMDFLNFISIFHPSASLNLLIQFK